jgi:predicted acylesterase/phospholipase RssA
MKPSEGSARRWCDLVMKGGVASGIVYPDAIFEISRRFDLKSVGGTSAGAIAAALAAAAQYRRARGGGDAETGYERLPGIADTLAQPGGMFALFRPNRATKALFGIVVDLFSPNRPRFVKALCLIRAYPLASLLGILPAALCAYAAHATPLPLRVLDWIVAAAIASLGAIAASAGRLLWDALRRLPRNGYGLVSGIADDPRDDGALTSWLTRELELVAGLEPGAIPLTFGMLWNPNATPGATGLLDAPPPDERVVNLQMVTTCLTEGRPYQFPTRTSRFFFRPDELAPLFPPHVLRWLCARARPDAHGPEGLLALPPIGDLPVIVATRMSLAFPILLSAVPLHAIDFTDAPPQLPSPVWFSDGGLTSNFPIQMFDAPLPRWPTLALNLGPFGPRTPADGVVTIENRSAGRLMRFMPIAGVGGFLAAMFDALQNWNDAMQMTLPGFRDRVATIALRPEEGGLNLDMDAATVARLRRRGADAAHRLVHRFGRPSVLDPHEPLLSWEGHRWTRLRVEFETLGEHVARFERAYVREWQPPDVSYARLIADDAPHTVPVRSHPLGDGAAGRAQTQTVAGGVVTLASQIAAATALTASVPRPAPSLVLRADLDR